MADNNNIEVGGRLHSIATGNVLTGANEVFDDDKNKKQSEINTETYTLVNEINAKLDTLSPEQQSALSVATKANKNEANLGYYVCETEANVAAKVVANATGYILSAGGSIKIKMNNANTVTNVTLNINSTGANPLYYDGERASATNTWEAGEIVEVYYDGTNFYANNVAGGGKFASGEKVKNVGIDSEPTAGSDNLVKSRGIQNELALGAVYDVSAKNPTEGHNNDGKWESLSALLSDANLSTLIPTAVRKGGMSIKFVQSSDNNYVQYRLMVDVWSTDTEDWSIYSDTILIENPEWVKVVTDKEDKILYGVKTDGNFYFGAGCPPQVVEYITEKLGTFTASDYAVVMTFLGDLIDGDTLSTLLNNISTEINKKVDKVAKKSLIDSEYADSQSVIENPEYLDIITDSNNKILESRKKDGSKYISGDLEFDSINICSKESDRNIEVIEDKNGKIIEERLLDGKKIIYTDTNYKGDVCIEGHINLKHNAANSAIEISSKEITSINAHNPYSYYYPRIMNMNMPLHSSTLKPFVLCHFSDIHAGGGRNNYARVMEFMSLYKYLYDDIILTGDIVSTKFSDSIDFMSSTENDDKCLLVIGNHDSWVANVSNPTIVDQKQVYDKFFAPWIAQWGVVQPENAATLGKCYYYKDYQSSKLRMIITDCMHDSQDQIDFVTAALEGARQKDYSVIMAQHYPANGINKVESPFQSVDFSGVVMESNNSYISAVSNFIANGGKFVCWISGHQHVDTFGYLVNADDQLQITVDCAAPYEDHDVVRTSGTRQQDCFNLYSVDTELGILTMLRVGANTDRHCRKKDVFVWDYINKMEIV